MEFECLHDENLRNISKLRAKESRLVDYFYPDNSSQIENLEKMANTLNCTFYLSERLLKSENPKEDLQRYIEMIIQKDYGWVSNEMDTDPRANFFFFYLLKKEGSKNRITHEEIYQKLLSKRFDTNFVSEIVSSLREVYEYINHFSSKMDDQLEKEYEKKEARNEHLWGYEINYLN